MNTPTTKRLLEIVFSTGLKECVSKKAGKEKVDAIIREELSHISTLNRITMPHWRWPESCCKGGVQRKMQKEWSNG